MPYITIKQSPTYHQITFDEILFGKVGKTALINANENNTRTIFTQNVGRFVEAINVDGLITTLENFIEVNSELYKVPRESLYDKFFIPKRSGGLREINAPTEPLMKALKDLKYIFENHLFASYHTSAFAYIPKRSTVDALKRHQSNESQWFLKTDFSNFFGSTTKDFLIRMLSMIFPFSEVMLSERGKAAIERAIDLCFLNGGLPQGTPISPMLTNLMMIPIDHRLYNCLRDFKGKHYIYTRYADDCLISCRVNFDMEEIIKFINDTLAEFKAPFTIKPEKTRYGSRAGANWNLGLMLNKDNQITIGHKNKQRFRAMLCNYILDKRNGTTWDLHDVQVLRGILNYYKMIEPDYVSEAISYNNNKFNVNVMQLIRADLSM